MKIWQTVCNDDASVLGHGRATSALLLLLGLLLTAALFGCQGPDQAQSDPAAASEFERPPLAVRVARLQPVESLSSFLEFSGTLRALRQTEVAFLRGGRLEQLYTDEGQTVAVGQLLAELDRRALLAREQELRAQLAQAEALQAEVEAGPRPFERQAALDEIGELQTQLDLVQTKATRRQELFRQGAIAREEVDEIGTEEERVEARLRAARSRLGDLDQGSRPETVRAAQARSQQLRSSLESLRVELDDTQLHAPYSGSIARKHAELGSFVQPGQPVFTLVGTDVLEAELFLPPAVATGLQVGQEVELLVNGSERRARLKQLLPVVEAETRTQRALFELLEVKGAQPGQLVRYRLQGQDPGSGYWIPSTALLPAERGLFACYTLSPEPDDEGYFRVERALVEVLQTQGETSFVRGTLEGPLEVIVEGGHRVVPGQRVSRE